MNDNGWRNYETWCVALWLSNDGIDADYFDSVDDVDDLALAIRDLVEELAPDLGASMFGDLLTSSLRSVDYDEIARSWWEDEAQCD